MKKSFLLTALAVATMSVNVLAIQAEAGTTGLKPSAGQAITQQSGSAGSSENKENQRDAYDTSRYAYPAEQLKAEGKNFNSYNWRLYLRFDTGELMLQDWVNGMNWNFREYSNNTYSRIDKDGKPTFSFDLREQSLAYFDKEFVSEGLKEASSDNQLQFTRNGPVDMDLPIRMNVAVHVNPAYCYPRGTQIVIPGATSHNGSGEPFSVYQDKYWYGAETGQITGDAIGDYNAKYGHAIEPIKLYYPSVGRALYVSGWCLDDVVKYMPVIDGVFMDERPENYSDYTYKLHHKMRSLPDVKYVR
jgi:hypothetical protein